MHVVFHGASVPRPSGPAVDQPFPPHVSAVVARSVAEYFAPADPSPESCLRFHPSGLADVARSPDSLDLAVASSAAILRTVTRVDPKAAPIVGPPQCVVGPYSASSAR